MRMDIFRHFFTDFVCLFAILSDQLPYVIFGHAFFHSVPCNVEQMLLRK